MVFLVQKLMEVFGLHFLLNLLIIYQITSISKKQERKDQLARDDLILYDEEENIKM